MIEDFRTLLALDSASGSCSAAIWHDGDVLASCHEVMERGQSERLVPMIGEVMSMTHLDFSHIQAIAVTRGPGAFTGVRIGLATARALALAWDLPLLGVSSLEAAAAVVPETVRQGRPIVVLLEAKRRDVYVQCFASDLTPLDNARTMMPEDLSGLLPAIDVSGIVASGRDVIVTGDAAERLGGLLAVSDQGVEVWTQESPTASIVAELAVFRPREDVSPLYLRPPDVTLPQKVFPPSGKV
ncbi:MAG: tRNA (adenosine(37)-N6)-threonylcarbamoyltransferase complex dimerization subunit type 1 TsaB [Pseudomonadota bacterium]